MPNVTLNNSDWDSVKVEVRRGNFEDCTQNAAYATQVISNGGQITVTTGDGFSTVCWRREAEPGSGGPFTDFWNRATPLNVHDLSLFPDTEGLAGFVRQKIRLHWSP
jgi:hypothetical protein